MSTTSITTTTQPRNKPPKRELSKSTSKAVLQNEKAFKMYGRKTLHLDLYPMVYSIGTCFMPPSFFKRAEIKQRIESFWSKPSDPPALVCLSVRTGFDLLLQVLNFPKESEVLICAINIDGMFQIVEHHGLIPVPIDLDTASLIPRMDLCQQALSPRSKMLYITYLFGARFDITPFIAFARTNNLVIVEDCAQVYAGPNEYRGHPDVDVSMFSFGTIKTATAMGSALFRVKDREVLTKMKLIENTYPSLGHMWFLKKVLNNMLLKGLVYSPMCFAIIVRTLESFNVNTDDFITARTRGFPGSKLIKLIRHQPPNPMLLLLERQLHGSDPQYIKKRVEVCDMAGALLGPNIERPGELAKSNVYWLFPVVVANPKQLIEKLYLAGFDATQGSSQLSWVQTPIPGDPTRSTKLYPVASQRILSNLVYIPVYSSIPEKDIIRLCEIVKKYAVPLGGRPGGFNIDGQPVFPKANL